MGWRGRKKAVGEGADWNMRGACAPRECFAPAVGERGAFILFGAFPPWERFQRLKRLKIGH